MIVADWVFLGIILGGLGIGSLVGFGKLFKFFTSGIFGIILSVVVCFLIGAAFQGPMTPLLDKLAGAIQSADNWFGDFLCKLEIEVILYYIIMFIIVWLLRFIVVRIVKAVAESENKVIKVVNRVTGALFFLAALILIALLVMTIIGWVGGSTSEKVSEYLNTSKLGLGEIYKFIASNFEKGEEVEEGVAVVLSLLSF